MSQRQRIDLQPAFVLHTYDYRDTSRIVEFLVRDYGRVAAVARGIRSQKNRQRGMLRPFQPLLVSWSGRELGTLTGLEPNGEFRELRGDAMLAGFYLNELCLKLLAAHDPHPEIHDLYTAALDSLREGIRVPATLRRFELGLLEALGYGLNLVAEPSTGEAISADGWYVFNVHGGPERRADKVNHPLCIHGSSLLAIAAGELDDEKVVRDAQRITRVAIDSHLGGRPLKSRDVLRAMYRSDHRDENRDENHDENGDEVKHGEGENRHE
jgi:DNA repair protein RecO (recombination protein O)